MLVNRIFAHNNGFISIQSLFSEEKKSLPWNSIGWARMNILPCFWQVFDVKKRQKLWLTYIKSMKKPHAHMNNQPNEPQRNYDLLFRWQFFNITIMIPNLFINFIYFSISLQNSYVLYLCTGVLQNGKYLPKKSFRINLWKILCAK